MARFNDNFGSYATAAGVPTGYTARWETVTATYAIVEDVTSPGGKYLEIEKTGSGRPLITLDVADGDDQGVVALLEFEASSGVGVWINAAGTEAAATGYLLQLTESTNTIGLWEGTGGGAFTNHDNDTSLTLTAGTRYWVRFMRFDDGKVKGRVWLETDDEPTTWNVEVTDSSWTTGWCGVSELQAISGQTAKVHYLSAATDYDTPCIVEDDDFPLIRLYQTSSEDKSIRITDPSGPSTFVIKLFEEGEVLQEVTFHDVKEKIYATLDTSASINRYDQYGLNEEVLITGVTDAFGVTFDYDNSRMYYTNRQASSELFKATDDGGSPTQIVSGIVWGGHCYFNADDGFIYATYDDGVRSYDSDGNLQVTYSGLNQLHWVLVDGTNVMAGSWGINGLWYIPIAGGSWTNADSTYRLWNARFGADRNEIYAAAYYDDLIVKYDTLPPPSSGNKSILSSGNEHDKVHSVSYADLTPVVNPVVASVTPDEGAVGTEIVLGGTDFTGATSVTIDGTEVDSFTVDSDTQITATVAVGTTSGVIEVTTPSGAGTSTFVFTVLPTLPPDGWQIELYQIQVNAGETDIEMVTSTYKQYYTEGDTDTNIDMIPTSISNAERSLEWDEGVYRLGSIDVTVQLLEEDYFNDYTNYIDEPYVLVIRDADGNVVFHGPVDPETAKYNANNRATAFRVLSWEVLLEGIAAPCRSIYETQFSRNYNDASVGSNSVFYIKKTLNGVDLSTVATTGSVLVFDTPAGEYRAIVLDSAVDGDDLAITTISEITVYLTQNKVISAGSHSVSSVGSGGLAFRRLTMEFTDASLYELLEQIGSSDSLLLQVDVNGNSYTMQLKVGVVDTSGAWATLDDDRQTIQIKFNICSGICNPATLETDFLNFGSTISITSNTSADAGDQVRILGKDMYGYDGSTEVPFGAINHYLLNGGVIQGMFALPELGVIPYIVDTFVFPAGFTTRFDRWGELPPNLLEALRQLQNTAGTFIGLTSRVSNGLPRVTVTVKDRDEANTTDSTVISNIVDILDWTENAADLTPTAVVVQSHIQYFKPANSLETVGFYYNGVDLADPATTGKPQNGRVVTITVNVAPSYAGDIFFGDGTGVRNDNKLKAIAKKYYEYYNSVRRPCEFKFDGTPDTDILGSMITISVTDDPIAGTTFTRTLFVTGVIVDTNTNQTTVRGRIGEFSGVTSENPVAFITGQLVWADVDDSGDEDVTLSGLNSYDPQNQELTYSWKRDTVEVSTSAVYQETLVPGEYDIELTVTDTEANTATDSAVLKVVDVSEDLGDGSAIQARFTTATWNFNEDGDLSVTVEGDEYTQTTNGIKIRTADTQVGLDAAGDTSYNNPQVDLEIIATVATNATKWVRITLINDVDGSDSTIVWEFSVTNIAPTSALIIPAGLSAPTSTADATGVDGEIRADASYIYVKINGTGWVRASLASF